MYSKLKEFCHQERMGRVFVLLVEPQFVELCQLAEECYTLGRSTGTSNQELVDYLQPVLDRANTSYGPNAVHLLRVGICLFNGCTCPIPKILSTSCNTGLPCMGIDFNK